MSLSIAGCELCESPGGEVLHQGTQFRVVLVEDADYPGFCRVIWNHHVAEMTDLAYGEREHLMSLVFAVEEAIRHVMCPDKVNIAALGNMVPHIHWHVIPRYKDDAFFPGSAWSKRVQELSLIKLAERQQLASQLPAVIKAAIATLS